MADTNETAEDAVLHIRVTRAIYDRLVVIQLGAPFETSISGVARGLMIHGLEAEEKKEKRVRR